MRGTTIQPRTLHVYRFCLVSLLVFITSVAIGQAAWSKSDCPRSWKEAGVWYFGDKAGVDFRSGTAGALTDQNVMSALQATASICDSLGNFQFFTNGKQVWDRTDSLMPNATNLFGNPGVTQPCVIVPRPGDGSQYYLFTVDAITYDLYDSTKYTTKGLSYTIIDMKLRNGKGDASPVILNVPLFTPVCQKITAVANHDRTGYWVIVHKWESNEFHAFEVTGGGISSAVVSAVGTFHGAPTRLQRNNAVGYMKCSPDGKHIAAVQTQDRIIDILDFNDKTGAVSAPQTFHVTQPEVYPYGLEFSPDSQILYATVLDYLGTTLPKKPTFVYQFDLRKPVVAPAIIDSMPGRRLYAMQLGMDGRIYLSRTVKQNIKLDSLEVIYNPNRLDTLCNVSRLNNMPDQYLSLAGRKSVYSLPNFMQTFLNIPTFTWDSVCHGEVTQFRVTNKANIDSVFWDFGDGNSSRLLEPLHLFTTDGTHKVKLFERFNGKTFIDSMNVTTYALPKIGLADTILLYSGSSINLHAGGGYTEYTWSNGSADSIITVSRQDSYSVRVKDVHCCYNSDTTFVRVFNYFIPNAFSPNGDGLNDYFRVYALYKNISFSMVVYNRWGQLVFESDDVDKVWDGTSGGQMCPPDSYVWIVKIKFLGQDIITQGDVVFKGSVTIVR